MPQISLRPGDGRGKAERVCDIVRDMFVAESMEAVAEVVRLLREASAIEIVRVKDRFTTPSAGGWRDLMINYTLAGDAHCCEVQICHNSLLVARKGLPGHAIYGRVRNANELLGRLGLLDESTNRLRLTGCKEAGVSCAEAKMVGLTLKEIRTAGYTCSEAKEAEFTLEELLQQDAYTVEEMGGVLSELKEGATEQLLKKVRLDSMEQALTAQELDWSRKRLDGDDVKLVAFLMAESGALMHLKLHDNKIGDAGAIAIADALRINGVMTNLNLNSNLIGVEGGKAIAEALKVNSALTGLNLNENQIGDAGASAIADALHVNGVVTQLGLRENKIGDKGAAAIAKALEVNVALTKLDLKYNSDVGQDSKDELRDAVRRRVSVFDLGLL